MIAASSAISPSPSGIVRLDDVVGGAEAHGFDDDLRLLAAREHDHLQLGPRRLQRLQRLQAVHAGHGDVEQHDVGRLALADRRDDLVAARVGRAPRSRAAPRNVRRYPANPESSSTTAIDGRRSSVAVAGAGAGAPAPATVVIVVDVLRHGSSGSRSADAARGGRAGRRPERAAVRLDHAACHRQREAEAAAPFVECGGGVARRVRERAAALASSPIATTAHARRSCRRRQHRPRHDARFAALAQRRCIKRREGRGEPRAIAGHRSMPVDRRARASSRTPRSSPSCIPLASSADKRGQVEILPRERDLAAFELAELAHLRDQRAERGARSVRFFQHLRLFLGERSGLFAQQHAQVADTTVTGVRSSCTASDIARGRTLVFDCHVAGLESVLVCDGRALRLDCSASESSAATVARDSPGPNLIRRPARRRIAPIIATC